MKVYQKMVIEVHYKEQKQWKTNPKGKYDSNKSMTKPLFSREEV